VISRESNVDISHVTEVIDSASIEVFLKVGEVVEIDIVLTNCFLVKGSM